MIPPIRREFTDMEKVGKTHLQKTLVKLITLSSLSFVLLIGLCFVNLKAGHRVSFAAATARNTVEIAYVHTATAANSVANWTNLSGYATDGNPNATVFATPNWNPSGVGGVYDNHALGVWYTGHNWAIFNQDLTPIPPGASFNVLVFPYAVPQTFVQTVTVANSVGNWTNLSNSITNGNPNVTVLVTPNWNPGGVGGVYDNHAIGVWYTGRNWAIFNQDLTPIPPGASFNVLVFPHATRKAFVQTATGANSVNNWTNLNSYVTNSNPNAIVFATPNWNPGDVGGVYDNHAIGVWYTGHNWAIFNQDLTAMPIGASFNVLAFFSNITISNLLAGIFPFKVQPIHSRK